MDPANPYTVAYYYACDCPHPQGAAGQGMSGGEDGTVRLWDLAGGGLLAMPRKVRASASNQCCHVLVRGKGRRSVFFKDGD